MNKKNLMAVVLGAGKGTRLASEEAGIPKVMRSANGKPLLGHVLDRLNFIEKQDTVIVVGYKKESIINKFPGYVFAVQVEQLGTGHAVMAAGEQLKAFEGDVLVCYGDMPLIRTETYVSLIDMHRNEKNACTVLSGVYDEEMAYGRIVRNSDGEFERIVEARDCNEQEQRIREYNSGIYMFDCRALLNGLDSLDNKNNQREYYLTDVPGILQERGFKVGICSGKLGDELIGVNTQAELEQVERILSQE